MAFKREINTFGVLCASLGGIIGSGWLFGCLFAAQMAGPASIISWIIGGVSVMFLALTFAELASMFPISGGVGVYPIFTHGKIFGFTLTWITWITYVVSVSQEVQSTIFYLGNKYPSWVHKVNGITQFTQTGFFVAFSIMFFLVCLNSFGSRFLSRANSLVSVWKFIVPVATVVVFLWAGRTHSHIDFPAFQDKDFAPSGFNGILSAVALAGVLYSFCGFQHGALLAGEAKNPQRSVPIALIGSILICIVLYTGLQYAFIKVLPPQALIHGWANLSFVGDAGPLAGLAAILGLTWLVGVLYVDSVISPLGTGVLYIASSARVVQSMGTSGNAPRFFAKITRLGTPLRAIIINFILSMLAFMPFKGWQAIVSFLSSALVFSFMVGPLCLVALRKQQPDKPRPFRLPCYQLMSFIAFYVCNLMIFWSGFDVVWKLAVTLAAGVLVFIASDVFKKHQATVADYRAVSWLAPYMIVLCLLSYYSSFPGGINKIPLGIDFFYVFLLSLVTFGMAQKLSLSHIDTKENIQRILSFK